MIFYGMTSVPSRYTVKADTLSLDAIKASDAALFSQPCMHHITKDAEHLALYMEMSV